MKGIAQEFYRGLVEKSGGIFIGIQAGATEGNEIVMFQRVAGGNTIAVYAKALRTLHDVELALKADAEKYALNKFEVGV